MVRIQAAGRETAREARRCRRQRCPPPVAVSSPPKHASVASSQAGAHVLGVVAEALAAHVEAVLADDAAAVAADTAVCGANAFLEGGREGGREGEV